MKKYLKLLVVTVVFSSFLAGCGSTAVRQTADSTNDADADAAAETQADVPEEGADGDVYVMRVGHAQTEESPRQRSLEYFKNEVEEKTDGKVTVEIYPNGEFGDETEMTVAVSEGSLEAVRGGDLEFVPKSQLLGLPMIADDLEQARQLCYSDYMSDMLSSCETEYGMKVLAVGDDSGFRQITNSVRPIKNPTDLKGLKIRAPQIVATVNFFDEIGASATVIPFTELYDSLASGKVDGQENPLALIDSSKFYEVQQYCTLINYQFFPELMYVNLEWWNSLPSEYQSILSSAARNMMDENARITDAENEAYIRHIEENGCEVYELSEEERDAFEEYAVRSWQKYIDDGYATKEDLDDLLAVIGKTVE